MNVCRSLIKRLSRVSEVQRIILFVFLLFSTFTAFLVWVYLFQNTPGSSNINQFIEVISGRSSGWLGQAGLFLPLGFAFGAGMASAVNPCGFPMVPAYITMYIGSDEPSSRNSRPMIQLIRALYVGAMVTFGFGLLFGVAGILLTLGTRVLVLELIPFFGVTIGVSLMVLGLWIICGLKIYTSVIPRTSTVKGISYSVSAMVLRPLVALYRYF